MKEWYLVEEENEYQKQVQKVMDIVGINSPSDLSDEDKKKFFSYLDTVWDKENDKVLNEPSAEELKTIFPDLMD